MISQKIKSFAEEFETEIKKIFEADRKDYALVADAMEYSLADGGKRLRPFLMREFYRASGGKDDAYINFALAMECIHTYSLIHDDLPCMDNDDMRRGKSSCHKKFGEEYALLAGDGLLTIAFNLAAKSKDIPADRVIKAIEVLSFYAGIDGMVGGQTVDLLSEGKTDVTAETLTLICRLKTGALIKASCLIGCILAGADEKKMQAAEEYAEKIGLAFQIEDDILDVIGDEATLGKPINSDKENEKATFVSVFGIDECKKKVKLLTVSAKQTLTVFHDAADIRELADYLCNREF